MTSAPARARAARPTPTPDTSSPGAPDGLLNRALLAHALLAGVAGNALLHEPGPGIAFPVWIAIVALTFATDALFGATSKASGPAAPTIFDLDRCNAANTLMRRWGPSSEAVERQATRDVAWRSWNA
ncbi:MAG: hypothetical protein M3Z10_11900, partial [Gemmatimonadota bacterium]|nr:hypothetical protein [Gemmatimonadota bacterium]